MALTASEEALVRQLLDQQAALLSLAGNETTITSKLGATKVTLADLTAASSVADSDLFLIRSGSTEKSISGLNLKAGLGVVAASTSSAGIVELATVAEAQAGTDTARAVTPAGLASRSPAIRAATPIVLTATSSLDASHVNIPLIYSSSSAGTLTLPASPSTGDAITVYTKSTGVCTVSRAGTQTINSQGKTSATSIALGAGASVTLVYDGASWNQAAGNSSLGYGQIWRDVAGSRAIGTTYTNNNGAPIVVAVGVTLGNGSTFTNLSVDGAFASRVQGWGAGTYTYDLVAVVPPGSTYVVSGGSPTLNSWRELY
jgi:hypothetical protein